MSNGQAAVVWRVPGDDVLKWRRLTCGFNRHWAHDRRSSYITPPPPYQNALDADSVGWRKASTLQCFDTTDRKMIIVTDNSW